MMKDDRRAMRIHHRERIKNKVKNYHRGAHKDDERYIGILSNTRQPCSCYACGNPRKYSNRLTVQERKAPME
jgi:hypothetical protein